MRRTAHAIAPRWMLAVMLAGLTACASPPAIRIDSVERRLIMPEGSARYEMAAHQAFAFPVPQDNVSPVFPADYPARELAPTTLCVSFVVDAAGNPAQVNALAQEGCAPAEQFVPLRDAMLAAVRQWRFEPAMFCDYPDAATRDRDWNGVGCAGATVQKRIVPVSLAYAFTFSLRNGKGEVASAKR